MTGRVALPRDPALHVRKTSFAHVTGRGCAPGRVPPRDLAWLHLEPYSSFAQLTPDVTLQNNLDAFYNRQIDNVDLFIGGLAERHASAALCGPTFQAIIRKQFEALVSSSSSSRARSSAEAVNMSARGSTWPVSISLQPLSLAFFRELGVTRPATFGV